MGIRDALAGVFGFLGTRSQNEERMAQYVIREHHRGRRLSEILDDNYVKNRCTGEQVDRLLDRPELIHALGEDLVDRARQERS